MYSCDVTTATYDSPNTNVSEYTVDISGHFENLDISTSFLFIIVDISMQHPSVYRQL